MFLNFNKCEVEESCVGLVKKETAFLGKRIQPNE